MREIKFRVPDGVTGQYVYFALCDLGTANDTLGLNLDLSKAEQYTGLKDKYGKEIYEGDIVSFSVRADNLNPQKNNVSGSVTIEPFGTGYGYWSAYYCKNVFIIGNIHKNPEHPNA